MNLEKPSNELLSAMSHAQHSNGIMPEQQVNGHVGYLPLRSKEEKPETKPEKKPITYTEALEILKTMAQEQAKGWSTDTELVTLENAVGRIARDDIRSPVPTPSFDSSAMDGFAVNSQ